MRILRQSFLTLAVAVACFSSTWAEDAVLVVHVSDPQGKPIQGVVLSTTGDSSTGSATDIAGKSRIKLAPQTKVGSEVELVVVKAAQDLVFISPWNSRVTVRPFDNESQNVASIVLAERGNRMLLEYPVGQVALASKVNAANSVKAVGVQLTEEQRRATLAEVAKAYGLKPEEVDRAIRALGEKTTDPYQLGLVALYARNYPEAERQLTKSVEERERNLEKARSELADAQFFLGKTLYEKGRYKGAVGAYRRAVELRPDDVITLNSLALALHQDGEYREAEKYYQLALQLGERRYGPTHQNVGALLSGLGILYGEQGRYTEAEPLFKRALAIQEKALGSEHLEVGISLNNLAMLYEKQGRYPEAEQLIKRDLAISEKALGAEHPSVAASLNNLALIYTDQGKYTAAEPLIKRALAIFEKQLGPEHPNVATSLSSLAQLYSAQEKYEEAESLIKRALAIREKALGPEHPDVASSLNDLAMVLYEGEERLQEAEPLIKRALSIYEKIFGPEHPDVATLLNNLARLYTDQGKYTAAEPLFKRALAIQEKVLGPEHPDVAETLESYSELLRLLNRNTEAKAMEARAEKIMAKYKR
jgi:tetratricopeptide (TPR) repeat protein